jgi:hypothetical protein
MTRNSWWGLGFVVLVLSHAGAVHATNMPAVPEISPNSLSAGVAVLAGAVLILRSIRR